MKAIVYERYGPPEVLRLKEVEKPAPKDNEVRIRVEATTVTSADSRMRSLNVPAGFGFIMRLALGVRKPRQPILGTELAGEIEALGKGVSKFRVGDRVVALADTGMGCYIVGPAFGRAEDLRFLADLAEQGKFRPVIDRLFPFEQIVEAHRYVDTGHKKGNVVITLR